MQPVFHTYFSILKKTDDKTVGKETLSSGLKAVTSASNLEIESILSDNTISDDHKLKMYSTALNR